MLVRGGSGGSGMSCFHSEPRKEFGGPDGGDGGNGGHIILRGTSPGSSWGGTAYIQGWRSCCPILLCICTRTWCVHSIFMNCVCSAPGYQGERLWIISETQVVSHQEPPDSPCHRVRQCSRALGCAEQMPGMNIQQAGGKHLHGIVTLAAG